MRPTVIASQHWLLLNGVIQENNYFHFQKRFSCTKIMYSNGQQNSSSSITDFFNTMDHSRPIIRLYKCFYNSVRSTSIGTLTGGAHSVWNETVTVLFEGVYICIDWVALYVGLVDLFNFPDCELISLDDDPDNLVSDLMILCMLWPGWLRIHMGKNNL